MRLLPLFLASVLLVSSLPLRAAPDTRLFENLSGDRSVDVVFESTGCFHHIIYEFEFRRAETLTAKITEVKQNWDDPKKPEPAVTRKLLGTVKLTKDDAMGLDRLLAFYRKIKTGGCTTQDRISIKVMEAKKTVSNEQYGDATCSSNRIAGLTLFTDVISKLTSNKEQK